MNASERYLFEAARLLDRLRETQAGAIGRAVRAVAGALGGGGTLYAFGTGHSHMLAEELFYRAGGLVRVHPILDAPLMLHAGASRSSQLERLPGYAATLLHGAVAPGAGDALFVFSNSGRNAVPVEMALEAKRRGATTLCITSLAHASAVSPRNPAGLRLHEACDIVLDNCGVPGDAAIGIGPYRCGPTSTVAGAALLQAVVCGVVEALVAEGSEPEVFRSANEDGGDEANEAFLRKYRASIPML